MDGLIVVAEVTPGGAAAAAGILPGDVLRGCTAAAMQMSYPTANLLLGGIGRPVMKRILFPTARQSFATCMNAVSDCAVYQLLKLELWILVLLAKEQPCCATNDVIST